MQASKPTASHSHTECNTNPNSISSVMGEAGQDGLRQRHVNTTTATTDETAAAPLPREARECGCARMLVPLVVVIMLSSLGYNVYQYMTQLQCMDLNVKLDKLVKEDTERREAMRVAQMALTAYDKSNPLQTNELVTVDKDNHLTFDLDVDKWTKHMAETQMKIGVDKSYLVSAINNLLVMWECNIKVDHYSAANTKLSWTVFMSNTRISTCNRLLLLGEAVTNVKTPVLHQRLYTEFFDLFVGKLIKEMQDHPLVYKNEQQTLVDKFIQVKGYMYGNLTKLIEPAVSVLNPLNVTTISNSIFTDASNMALAFSRTVVAIAFLLFAGTAAAHVMAVPAAVVTVWLVSLAAIISGVRSYVWFFQ